MKRAITILLALVMMFAICACGNNDSAASDKHDNQTSNLSEDDIDNGVVCNENSVRVIADKVLYEDNFWLVGVTVVNDRESTIGVYVNECTVNGIMNAAYGRPIVCEPGSTINETFKLENKDLCYACNLQGINTINTIGLSLFVYEDSDNDGDIDAFNDEAIIKTDFVTVKVEPFTIEGADASVKTVEGTVVYEDENCRLTSLTVDKDYFGVHDDAVWYLLFENTSDIKLELSSNEHRENTTDILNSSGDSVTVNGTEVKVSGVIGKSAYVPQGTKMIIPVDLHLTDAGISVESIETMENDFRVYDCNRDIIADFSVLINFESDNT